MATMIPPSDDVLSREPFPASSKVYAEGSDPTIRVPFRAIAVTDGTVHTVHDTSGPFTDPDVGIDLRAGDRGDSRAVAGQARRHRHAEQGLVRLPLGPRGDERARRDPLPRHARDPARAQGRQRLADALRAARRDHARDGVRRDPRGPAAGVRARRGGPRARRHPGQRQPPRARADHHRAQLPGQDQRQHRQLGDRLVDRGRGREDGLGDPLGRRHGDGPLDRQEHPRDARVDHPQLRRCRSAPCRSTRRSRRSAARPRS